MDKNCKRSYTRAGEDKQLKGLKICASIRWECVKNAPKRSAKYLEDEICKIKQRQNITITHSVHLPPPFLQGGGWAHDQISKTEGAWQDFNF